MSDELDRVRRFRASEPAAAQATTERARGDLVAAISADGAAAGLRARSRARARARNPRPRLLLALTAACVAALVALALGTGSTAPTRAVAAALQRLAQAATGDPTQRLRTSSTSADGRRSTEDRGPEGGRRDAWISVSPRACRAGASRIRHAPAAARVTAVARRRLIRQRRARSGGVRRGRSSNG
jgi:hypothetical protein